MRSIALHVVLMIAVAAQAAAAVVLCARPKGDGTFNTTIKLRDACKPGEVQLDAAALGLRGPQGEQGPRGPEGPVRGTGPVGPAGPPFDADTLTRCFTWGHNADRLVIAGIRPFAPSQDGQVYPLYGRLALNGTCNGSSAVGLSGTAVLTPNAQVLRLYLSQPGMPFGCVPGWIRLDIDVAAMTGTWNITNPSTGSFAGSDLAPIDCTLVAPPS